MAGINTIRDVQSEPEARYSYYRRCQEFCKSGEQCKAPAEKGAAVCYAHARQRAMAARREAERRAVLTKAVEEMRRRGQPEFEMVNLFTSFHGIQITIATAARALIEGRIDCKTSGRLLWDLQRMAKLLRICYRKGKTLPRINTDKNDGIRVEDLREAHQSPPKIQKTNLQTIGAANEHEKARILKPEVLMFPRYREWPKGPPGSAQAA